MIALIQRVLKASVDISGETVGRIDQGLLVLWGVQKNDTAAECTRLIDRVMSYRVFSDQEGRMNLSLEDTGGALLLVPQFTLAADTKKGTRPSFSSAAPPVLGEQLFDIAVQYAQKKCRRVETGRFGADMQVSLVNDGPVTFWLENSPISTA